MCLNPNSVVGMVRLVLYLQHFLTHITAESTSPRPKSYGPNPKIMALRGSTFKRLPLSSLKGE